MSKEQAFSEPVNRRMMLAGSVALAGCSVLQGSASAARSPVEQANEDLVNRFCAAWSERDVEKLVPFLSETLDYQMFEGRPDLIGIAQFKREIGPFLAGLEKVQWEILRSYAIGPLVINERVDHFVAPAGGRSMHFQIAGYFLVKDGRIQVWKDYSIARLSPARG